MKNFEFISKTFLLVYVANDVELFSTMKTKLNLNISFVRRVDFTELFLNVYPYETLEQSFLFSQFLTDIVKIKPSLHLQSYPSENDFKDVCALHKRK